ncbi:hypothetical protein CA596_18420 [Paenibacillus odorifer]|nr:hypothetical protein CA596_18420 [Paenibacillus odorifer]
MISKSLTKILYFVIINTVYILNNNSEVNLQWLIRTRILNFVLDVVSIKIVESSGGIFVMNVKIKNK